MSTPRPSSRGNCLGSDLLEALIVDKAGGIVRDIQLPLCDRFSELPRLLPELL